MGVLSKTHPLFDLVGRRIRTGRQLHHLLPAGEYRVTETFFSGFPGEPFFRVEGCFEPIPAARIERKAIQILPDPTPASKAERLQMIQALLSPPITDDQGHVVGFGEPIITEQQALELLNCD